MVAAIRHGPRFTAATSGAMTPLGPVRRADSRRPSGQETGDPAMARNPGSRPTRSLTTKGQWGALASIFVVETEQRDAADGHPGGPTVRKITGDLRPAAPAVAGRTIGRNIAPATALIPAIHA
jgi:hypothetical protein